MPLKYTEDRVDRNIDDLIEMHAYMEDAAVEIYSNMPAQATLLHDECKAATVWRIPEIKHCINHYMTPVDKWLFSSLNASHANLASPAMRYS